MLLSRKPGFIAGGDLEGTWKDQEVIGVRGVPVRDTAPTEDYQVLVIRTDGTEPFEYALEPLTMDMIKPAFDFAFSGPGALIEVGATLATPAFTAAYSPGPPDGAATLHDTDNLTEQDVSATPTAFSSDFSFTKTAYGNAVTFRLTAKRGSATKQKTVAVTWVRKVYYFASTLPGAFPTGFTQAWVEGNHAGVLRSSKNMTFTVNAGGVADDKHVFFLCRDAYPPSTFWVGGFQGGFSKVGVLSLLTAAGQAEDYAVYQSNNVGLGSTTVEVKD